MSSKMREIEKLYNKARAGGGAKKVGKKGGKAAGESRCTATMYAVGVLAMCSYIVFDCVRAQTLGGLVMCLVCTNALHCPTPGRTAGSTAMLALQLQALSHLQLEDGAQLHFLGSCLCVCCCCCCCRWPQGQGPCPGQAHEGRQARHGQGSQAQQGQEGRHAQEGGQALSMYGVPNCQGFTAAGCLVWLLIRSTARQLVQPGWRCVCGGWGGLLCVLGVGGLCL